MTGKNAALTLFMALLAVAGAAQAASAPPQVKAAQGAGRVVFNLMYPLIAVPETTLVPSQVKYTMSSPPQHLEVSGAPANMIVRLTQDSVTVETRGVTPRQYPLRITGYWGNDKHAVELLVSVYASTSAGQAQVPPILNTQPVTGTVPLAVPKPAATAAAPVAAQSPAPAQPPVRVVPIPTDSTIPTSTVPAPAPAKVAPTGTASGPTSVSKTAPVTTAPAPAMPEIPQVSPAPAPAAAQASSVQPAVQVAPAPTASVQPAIPAPRPTAAQSTSAPSGSSQASSSQPTSPEPSSGGRSPFRVELPRIVQASHDGRTATERLTVWGGMATERGVLAGLNVAFSVPMWQLNSLNVALRGSAELYPGRGIGTPSLGADLLVSRAGSQLYFGPSTALAFGGGSSWALGGLVGYGSRMNDTLGYYLEGRARYARLGGQNTLSPGFKVGVTYQLSR